jgi:hypothetical protein
MRDAVTGCVGNGGSLQITPVINPPLDNLMSCFFNSCLLHAVHNVLKPGSCCHDKSTFSTPLTVVQHIDKHRTRLCVAEDCHSISRLEQLASHHSPFILGGRSLANAHAHALALSPLSPLRLSFTSTCVCVCIRALHLCGRAWGRACVCECVLLGGGGGVCACHSRPQSPPQRPTTESADWLPR